MPQHESRNPSLGGKPKKDSPPKGQEVGLEQGCSTTFRGSPVPLTEYLGGRDCKKSCPLGKGEPAGSGGRLEGAWEKSGPGGSASGTSPAPAPAPRRPPIPGGPGELTRGDSRGRPFPGFGRGSSAAALCGPELRACAEGQSTQSFATKVCRPGGQPLWLIQHTALPAGPFGAPGALCRRVSLSLPGPQLMAFGVSAPCIPQPSGKAVPARKRPAARGDDSRARPAPAPAAPGPRPPARSALTCAARRRRPQQQQQQQQRRGQQRGARAERAARFPAGVDIHAGGARGAGRRAGTHGARGTARAADSAGPAQL